LRGDDLEHFRKNHPYADFTSAIKNFQRALHLNCQNHSLNLHIRFHLAMALYFRAEMGDRAYAIQVLREAVDSMEGKALSGEEQIFMARLLREFGVILENENSKDEMLSCFENAADLCRQMQTEDPARYNLFARALVDLGIHLMDSDSQKALQYLEEASGVQAKVLNKKTLADLYLNLGLMYEKGGDLNQAFAAFEKASSLDFQDRDLYAQIAFNFARFAAGFKNDLDLSIGVLERALKLEIKDDALAADLHWLMMSHLFKRGRPADVLAAIARGQTALDLPFQNGAIRTKLLLLQAFLYQLVNNKKEAATHYKLAATIEGNTPQVKVLCNVNAANLLDELEMFKAAIKCLKAALADVDACENPVFKAKLCRALAIMYFKLSASIEDNESSIEIAKEGRGYLLMGLKVEHNDQTVKDLLFERLGFYFFGEQGIEDFGTDEERINAGRLLFSGSDMARAEALRLVLPILIEKKKDFAAAIRAVLQARSLVDQAAQAEQAHSQFLASLAYLAARANLELFKKEREQEQFEAARKELEKGFSLAQGLAQQAQFLTLQSQLFEEAKDFATAETLLKQACELWKTKDRLGLELLNHRARFMMRRAEDALHVQNSQEAIQKAKDAIELAGDQDLQLALIRRLGAIYLVTKKYDLALNLFLGEINANRGGPIHLAEVRVSYAGALHLSRGDLQVAYQYLKEADTLLGPNPEQLGERAITVKAAVNRIRSILDEEFARMQQPAEQQPLESDSVV
jgi:tetratricopeptide (TPR) repeat protein